MTAKKSYNRYFIIFQEEDKGYGIAIDKQPTGYTKIETRNGRCKVTVYAQNLVKDRGPYLCCLIDATKDPVAIAKLGTITVDETGRGETWWEYKEDDVAETGVPVDRFNVAAVIVEGDELRAPLTGYIGRDRIVWKDRIKPAAVEVKEEVQETVAPEEVEELDEGARKFKEYEDMINDQASGDEGQENNDADEHRHQETDDSEKEDKFEDSRQEGSDTDKDVEINEEPEKDEDASRKTTPEDNDNNREDSEEEIDSSDEEENNDGAENEEDSDYEDIINELANIPGQFEDNDDYRKGNKKPDLEYKKECSKDKKKKSGKHAAMFHEALKHFKEADDLVCGMKDVKWWKVPHGDDVQIKENSLYPYFCSIYHLKMTYPYINYIKYYKKPGHYYFGIKYDENGEVKYLMYGIEGRNTSLEQPYMGMTGFSKWYESKCKDKEKGIWVMFYNPFTGCILIPKNK